MTDQRTLFPPVKSPRLAASFVAAGRRGIAQARAALAATKPDASMDRHRTAMNALANRPTPKDHR